MPTKKRKNERIKICNIGDLKKALILEGHNLEVIDYYILKENFTKAFDITEDVFIKLYESLKEESITYKVDDIDDLINYIKNIIVFENEHKMLCEKIKNIKALHIYRVEYERIPTPQDDVEHILKIVEETKNAVSTKINEEGKLKLKLLEKEIDRDYVYAKDIELLKRILLCNSENVSDNYDKDNQIKILFIDVPKNITFNYIKAEKGSIEYHKHIKSYIPRMKRLIKNLDKYIIKEEHGVFKINQSMVIQDSVNKAIAVFNNKEFRAVSGKNDIEDSCTLIPMGEEYFKSCKVNKLGKLGIGYNRINDSEKKILEKINRLIKEGTLANEGELILYSKWEPCPSCYYVSRQFCEMYPKINFNIMYYKNYGEK